MSFIPGNFFNCSLLSRMEQNSYNMLVLSGEAVIQNQKSLVFFSSILTFTNSEDLKGLHCLPIVHIHMFQVVFCYFTSDSTQGWESSNIQNPRHKQKEILNIAIMATCLQILTISSLNK